MKTTTIEMESPELLDGTPGEVTMDDMNPDFSIEGTGGPSDSGSQGQVGSGNPPPAPY